MAKADGVLHDKERESLEASLGDIDLPDVDLDTLLAEDWAVEDLLEGIEGPEARGQSFGSMFAMAYADGECSSEERALLDTLKSQWEIDDAQEKLLANALGEHDESVVAGTAETFEFGSGIERKAKVDKETRKTAIISAVLGAFPFPIVAIVADLAILGLQIGLAKDIAKYWGKEMNTQEAKGLLGGFGVGSAARIAVTNLLKVFPGWGSAAGAATAYASSYAVGHVVNAYFESGEGIDPADLKKEFKKAKAEAKKAYAEDKATIDEKTAKEKDHMAELGEKLKKGEITQAEFEREVAAL